MSTIDSFPTHILSLEEAPEIFRLALQENLAEQADLILYSPSFQSERRQSASLFAITASGWLVLTDDAEGNVRVHRASYDDTLLLELTVILLYGCLRIDYLVKGRAQSVSMEFNAVRSKDYESAVFRVLGHIDGQVGNYISQSELDARLDPLPLKFHNAALRYLPIGQRLHSVVHWPACVGGMHRWLSKELAPEAMMLLTDRELMLISEERAKSWFRIGQGETRYGSIITYLPLPRLGRCRLGLEKGEPLAMLEIELHRGNQATEIFTHATDTVRVGLPPEMADEVSAFLKQVAEHLPHTAAVSKPVAG
jgi:hypothetical protein